MTVNISLKVDSGTGIAYSDAEVTFYMMPRKYDAQKKLHVFPEQKLVLMQSGSVDFSTEVLERFKKALDPGMGGYPAYVKLLSDKSIELKLEYKDKIARDQLGISFDTMIQPNKVDKELGSRVMREIERTDERVKDTKILVCGFDKKEYTARTVYSNGIIGASRPVYVEGATIDAEHKIRKGLGTYENEPNLYQGVLLVLQGSIEARNNPGVGGIGNLAILKEGEIKEFDQDSIALMHNLISIEEEGMLKKGTALDGITKLVDGKPANDVLKSLNINYQEFAEKILTTKVL